MEVIALENNINMTLRQAVKKILNFIPCERIFILVGPLGSGKTTLTKLIAKKLGIKEILVSPTFILWQKYEFRLNDKEYFLNHLDLYRLQSQDILKLGLKKEISKKNNIFFIEWGEKLKLYLRKRKISFIEIIIKKTNGRREFIVKYHADLRG